MFDYLVSPFLDNQFMLNALIAGVVLALSCGVIGSFVVLRGLAFIGDALAHGVLPGIAFAVLLGLPSLLGATVGSIVMIAGIALITSYSRLSSDTAIGLFFVAMLALGVVVVSHSHSFSGDLVHLLFGEILGLSTQDIITQSIAALGICLACFVFRRPFLLLCFSNEQTHMAGFSVRLFHTIMLILIALTVIVSFKTVGTLLVFGMLLAPSATSILVFHKISIQILAATLIGSFASYTGLLISFYWGTAAGATIVLVATVIFFIVFFIQAALRNVHSNKTKESVVLPATAKHGED